MSDVPQAVSRRGGWANFLRYANPVYHVRRMIEDCGAARHALACRDLEVLELPELAKAIRGRLFACFFIAGACGFFGPVAGTALQYITRSPWLGFYSSLAIGQLAATLAFQIVWWLPLRRAYAKNRSPLAQLMALERDVLPVQLQGLRWTLIFAVVAVPVQSAVVFAISTLFPQAATYIPMAAIAPAFNAIFVDCTFIRVMGDIFDRHSQVLAERYHAEKAVNPEGGPHPTQQTAAHTLPLELASAGAVSGPQ